MLIYYVAKFLVALYMNLFYRVKITGLKNVPESGRAILISNHISVLDPLAVAYRVKRKIYFMAKEELFRNSIFAYVMKCLGAFPVKRGKVDIGSVRNTLKLLEEDKMLGIFPEGTRSKTGNMQRAFPGVASFALKSGAPIVPVLVSGRYTFFGKVRIIIGKPFKLEGYEDRKYSSEELAGISELIMSRVKALAEER